MWVFFPEKTIFSMDVEQSIDGAMAFFDFLNETKQTGEFFFTGKIVQEHPVECQKISCSHFVGAHGFEHEDFSRLDYSAQKELVEKIQDIFSESKLGLQGWRFPKLQFNSASMRVLAEKHIPDFSLSEQKLRTWGNAVFLWNFLKCAVKEQTLFFPAPFPKNLEEHPFSAVDLFEKNIFECEGRIIVHCYNFGKISRMV